MKNNAIIVCSGGLDSSVTAYYVKEKLRPRHMILLFFDYAQRTLREEHACAKKIAKHLNADFLTVRLPWLGKISTALLNTHKKIPTTTVRDLGNLRKQQRQQQLWWVPCRNSLFLLTALAHAESLYLKTKKKYTIYSGIKTEGRIPLKDTTPQFMKQLNKLAREATYHGNYTIKAPLLNLDKDEVVTLGKKLHVPFQHTYSCYAGKGFTKKKILVHCGTCANCQLRKTGFYWANTIDPSVYAR